jgi:hypothetical protein
MLRGLNVSQRFTSRIGSEWRTVRTESLLGNLRSASIDRNKTKGHEMQASIGIKQGDNVMQARARRLIPTFK